jgi:membrane protein YqaA with SNARE-associated domain
MEQTQEASSKSSGKSAYIVGIAGAVLTIAMAFAVIYFGEWVRGLKAYGYLGAFIISILGGATIIIPVPMLAVVFALGGVMHHTWLVGLVAAMGETIGAVAIYLTGYGGGNALRNSKHGFVQRSYDRLMNLMERKASITLFILAAVVNPFFYPAALAAGALRYGIKKYFLICFVGKIIKGMTVVYAGFFGLKPLFNALGISF